MELPEKGQIAMKRMMTFLAVSVSAEDDGCCSTCGGACSVSPWSEFVLLHWIPQKKTPLA